LLKSSPFQEVLESISIVHRGGSMMSPSISRKIADFFLRNPVPVQIQVDYGLSDRENDVLRGLSEGHSYKKIASDLFIAIDTVRSHIRKIYEKLEVHSKSEAVIKALEEKLVTPRT
jgi:DNA-binding NarL/FixJ family response regulator